MIMANWTGVITNAGNDVLSEWVNEKTLNFDSAAAGQGTVATAGMLAQTALVNQKQTASIIGADRVSTGIRLKIRITAPKTAYTLNQYGVWASVTDGSSTMIALFQHEDGIPIPSATESPDFVYTFYALISTSNTGEWTVSIDTSTSVTLEEMNSAIATAVATKEGLIKDADAKNSIADADAVAVVDSADSSKTKRVLWSTIKSALGQIFVPLTRKINNKALSADITLTGDDIKTSATDETTVSSSLSNLESALTTPPQEFNLPLAEPYDGLGKYLKTQENIVIVDVNIGTTSGDEISNNNMTFATLPAGFRPSRVVYSDAVTLTSDSGAIVGIAQFWIDTNGSLNLRVPSGSYRLRGELVFLAAN